MGNARWLKTVEGEIVLDVRFLGEMEGWMTEVMGGVAKCQMCRKVVVRGIYCECEDLIAWHKYCLAKHAKGVDTKCKKCKAVVHTAEGAVRNGKRKEQEDQDGKDEDDEDIPMTQTQRDEDDMPPPRTKGTRKRKE